MLDLSGACGIDESRPVITIRRCTGPVIIARGHMNRNGEYTHRDSRRTLLSLSVLDSHRTLLFLSVLDSRRTLLSLSVLDSRRTLLSDAEADAPGNCCLTWTLVLIAELSQLWAYAPLIS